MGEATSRPEKSGRQPAGPLRILQHLCFCSRRWVYIIPGKLGQQSIPGAWLGAICYEWKAETMLDVCGPTAHSLAPEAIQLGEAETRWKVNVGRAGRSHSCLLQMPKDRKWSGIFVLTSGSLSVSLFPQHDGIFFGRPQCQLIRHPYRPGTQAFTSH